ncbi:MAG: methyl-accepting chemotaxis protein [Azoarcus sp.]|jgi:methyl-accepting chemotaxis protein|nr:methyl-accepting chemotaxis protein [Azoarcus sp.]
MAHLKLRSLLTIGFGLLLGMFAAIGSMSLYYASSLSTSITGIVNYRMPNVIHFGSLETQTYSLRSLALSVFVQKEATPAVANILNDIISARQKTWTEIDLTKQKIDALPPKRQDTKELYAKLYATLDNYRKINGVLDSLLPKLAVAANSKDEAQYRALQDEYQKSYDMETSVSGQLHTLISECAERHETFGIEDGNSAIGEVSAFSALVVTLGLSGIIAGILIGFAILRAVLRQIGGEPAYIQSVMERVSNADLSVNVALRPGDTSSALYSISITVQKLRDIVNTISHNANQIATASEELKTSSGNIATSCENQSQAAASMAAAVEQMTVSINHVAESANDANKMAQQSGEAACEGAETIRSVVADINRVARDIGSAAKSVEDLGEQSREIASVVSIIKEVADQTNLLALNAAIEAARAGEQGRGFAVVADEVRKLAERTSSSTEDIARIVSQISAGTGKAVQTMRQQSDGVKTTVDLSERAGTTVEKINEVSGAVLSAVSEISLALSEQSTASSEIAKNVEYIASMSEDNTTSVRGAAEAAQGLSSLATQLQETVNSFKL